MSDENKLAGPLFNPFASDEITPAYSDHWEARRRVAQALRDLTDVLVTSTPPTEQLHTIADALEAQAKSFSESERIYGILGFTQNGNHGGFGEINHELNALAGMSNPLSPGLNMWFEGTKAFGSVNFGYAYEGPPGFVHGGYVAAILDQFLGMAQIAGKNPGMTGTLSIRYYNPTPLNIDLKLEATISKVEGRKSFLTGEIYADGIVTASCEGLFIRPSKGLPHMKNNNT
ncbi:MAG: hypothetical protein ACJAZ0_000522 [Halioglobus sp.]|jgi:hypothetical protein